MAELVRIDIKPIVEEVVGGTVENSTQLDDRDTANRDTDNHTDGTVNGVYTLVERDKLSGIEDSATADQTSVEIKDAYNSEYVQRTASNYINSATNIDEAVDTLDSTIATINGTTEW